ncbi:MAG: MATE family efflux transporter, partial [Rudaea sp.]
MHDLTEGSILRHLIRLAMPIAIGMLFQTLYVLIDLYFVAHIGDYAIAGVGAAGNAQFLIMALTQVLGVGTMALIAQASGRKDRDDANLIFNQSLLLAAFCAIATLLGGYALTATYISGLAADAHTVAAGTSYLHWFLPGLALQFALVAMGSALRGTGIVKPTMLVQMITVLLNALLAPILIAGWITHRPLGVAGAGLASSISIAVGVVLMLLYFVRLEKYVGFDSALFRPRLATWKRILKIGLPPGGEFALMFVYMAVIYAVIRHFGAVAQAGFGIGSRVMQAIFLPAMAVAFAVAPLAGQNFGGGHHPRVRDTFRSAALLGSAIMLMLTLMCQWRPEWFVHGFTRDPAVVAIGGQFLHIISWNFVASGLIFTCSGLFQALGNTLPALASSAT